MKNCFNIDTPKELFQKTSEYLVRKSQTLKPVIAAWYTGPTKRKAITITAAGSIAILCCSAIGIHALTHHDKITDTVYAVSESTEFTTVPETTATDAAPEETSALEETTTAGIPETTTVQETVTESPSSSETGIIPVSELDISTEDLSTNNEVINRIQSNTAPALPSGLKNITGSNDYTSHTGFLTGIDVSKHQGTINWTKVKNDGIEFAFIKVAGRGYETGKLYYDTQYKANLSGAAAAGIKTGAYFFSQATTVQEAREEASMIIDALKDYKITYPVVFDWETAEGYRTYSGISKSTMTEMAETFCSMVEAAGYQAMIYANTFDFERFHAKKLTSSYGSWLARYPANYNGNHLRFKVGDGLPALDYPYQIWQYSSTGQVDGISENVDMNVAFIDFSGIQPSNVPMYFATPAEEYYTPAGTIPDLLTNVQAFNCAGINSTKNLICRITDSAGIEVPLEKAACTAGKYTVTYSLKDFTGYTGYKSLPLYVQAAPVISLHSISLTVSRSVSYEELLLIIKENLISALDFTGTDLCASVEIQYPDSFFELVSEEQPQENTSSSEETSTPPADSRQECTTEPDTSSEEDMETTNSETTSTIPEETTAIEIAETKKLLPGTYTIVYKVTDSYGFSTTVELALIITD